MGPDHIAAESVPTIKERIDTIIIRIETIASLASPIPLSEMHDIRKQLRGFLLLLAIRQEFYPDRKLL